MKIEEKRNGGVAASMKYHGNNQRSREKRKRLKINNGVSKPLALA
jgi:hypothetical protein